MCKADCYELRISPSGIIDKKKLGILIIDFQKVETISEGESATESVLHMESGGKFFLKMNFYELKERYERFHGKIA